MSSVSSDLSASTSLRRCLVRCLWRWSSTVQTQCSTKTTSQRSSRVSQTSAASEAQRFRIVFVTKCCPPSQFSGYSDECSGHLPAEKIDSAERWPEQKKERDFIGHKLDVVVCWEQYAYWFFMENILRWFINTDAQTDLTWTTIRGSDDWWTGSLTWGFYVAPFGSHKLTSCFGISFYSVYICMLRRCCIIVK